MVASASLAERSATSGCSACRGLRSAPCDQASSSDQHRREQAAQQHDLAHVHRGRHGLGHGVVGREADHRDRHEDGAAKVVGKSARDVIREGFSRMYHPVRQTAMANGWATAAARLWPTATGRRRWRAQLAGVSFSVPLPSLPAIVQRPSRRAVLHDLVDDQADRVAQHIGGGEGVVVARADAVGGRCRRSPSGSTQVVELVSVISAVPS